MVGVTGSQTAREDAAGGASGVAARRAVLRWALRMFRREWRQQVTLLLLLGTVVAAAGFSVTAAYNLEPSEDSELGAADRSIRFAGANQRRLDDEVAALEEWFGRIEVIESTDVALPGSLEAVQLRVQDPGGPYGGSMLDLVEGRYPSAEGEIAVTDAVGDELGVTGLPATVRLGEREWTVVGRVENPLDLGAEFALADRLDAGVPRSTTVLLRTTDERFESYPGYTGVESSAGGDSGDRAAFAASVLLLDSVLLLLVCLVTAAGFVVVAQRRARHLGMLASLGATDRHLRLAMLSHGAVVGAVAAVLGASVAVVGWVVASPSLEAVAGHRMDRLDVPWLLVGVVAVLSVVTATAAAWWPARLVARIPIVAALSGRPVRQRPVHRSLVLAVLLIVIGVACLAIGDAGQPPVVVVGLAALVLGVLSASPVAVWAVGALAGRVSVGVRLALRDLARFQARSGAALAAISLTLGLAIGVVVVAADAAPAEEEGNLSDRQMIVWIGDPEWPSAVRWEPVELDRLETTIERIAQGLHEPTVIPLDVAMDPDLDPVNPADIDTEGRSIERWPVTLGTSPRDEQGAPLYVATPELLRYYDLAPSSLDPGIEVITEHRGDLWFFGAVGRQRGQERPPVTEVAHLQPPRYTSLPTSLVTTEAVQRHGWILGREGWLIETAGPLTGEQRAAARDIAAAGGLIVETRDQQEELTVLRTGASVAGVLLALTVLALTVRMIRGEAAGDLRILAATGAASRTRRTITAATAGALALLGVAIGTFGAYLVLTVAHRYDIGSMSSVPVPLGHLLLIAATAALAAGAGGWLMGGREPTDLGRHPIE